MRVRHIFWGFLLLAAFPSSLGAGEKLTIKVFPTVSFAPADFVVQASIEANGENRALELIADSPDFYRSSTIELNGERAPRTTVFQLHSLPSGRYEVTARLFGPSGQTRAAVRRSVNVISPGR